MKVVYDGSDIPQICDTYGIVDSFLCVLSIIICNMSFSRKNIKKFYILLQVEEEAVVEAVAAVG